MLARAVTLFPRHVARHSVPAITAAMDQLQIRNKFTRPEWEGLSPRALGNLRKKDVMRPRPRQRKGKKRYYGDRRTKQERQEYVDSLVGIPEAQFEEEESLAQKFATPWNIQAAGIMNRLPIVMKEPEDWEKDFAEVQQELEDRFGKKYPDEWTQGDSDDKKKSKAVEEVVIPDRITEDDRKNNRRSTWRRLDDHLFLVVKDKSGQWSFPTYDPLPGMQMRDSALIGLRRDFGRDLTLHGLGYPPCAFSQEPYDPAKQKRDEVFGHKVFFYRSQLIAGVIKVSKKKYVDYAWIAKDELAEYFKDERFCHYMSHVLAL